MAPTVGVVGLWHLGSTIAACLASAGFRVIGTDPDPHTVAGLQQARLPVEEPGLSDLIRAGLASGALTFDPDGSAAVRGADVVWVCFDTPVNDRDEADIGWVRHQTERLVPHLREGAVVLVSSQVPVGFTRALRDSWSATARPPGVRFAYSPENLRLGQAIESFRRPARTVVGTETGASDGMVGGLVAPFGGDVLWMTLESAEISKHALNAFLGVSVAFINEVARLCEVLGADAKEVERALKSEPRIGPRAYLSPGPAFAGGTLARDLRALEQLGASAGVSTPLLAAVLESNSEHAQWLRRTLEEVSGGLRGARVGILGLTYKPGTNTLRRSSALELCAWLAQRGAHVRAHDPAVSLLPADADARIELVGSPTEALAGAEVAVVATPWAEYRRLTPEDFLASMKVPRVIDQARFLAEALASDPRIQYRAVGSPSPRRGGVAQ
jgi:UDPglucose 6-dehydrogenase